VTAPETECPKPAVQVRCPIEVLQVPPLELIDIGDRAAFNRLRVNEQLARLWYLDIHHRIEAADLHDRLEQAVSCIRSLQ